MEYILIPNFKCKRCGCTEYDKQFFPRINPLTLEPDNDLDNAYSRYICRNCDLPFDLQEYDLTNATIIKRD